MGRQGPRPSCAQVNTFGYSFPAYLNQASLGRAAPAPGASTAPLNGWYV